MAKKKKTKRIVKKSASNVAIYVVIIAAAAFVLSSVFGTFNSQRGPVTNVVGEAGAGVRSEIIATRSRVAQFPDDVAAWTKLGNLYFDNGQAAASIEAYQQSLRLNPSQPDVWTDMGVMYRDVKDYNKALESFSKAIELDSRHEIARLNRGIVLLYDLNDKQGAAKAWDELLAINPVASTPSGESVASLVRDIRVVRQPQLLNSKQPAS